MASLGKTILGPNHILHAGTFNREIGGPAPTPPEMEAGNGLVTGKNRSQKLE